MRTIPMGTMMKDEQDKFVRAANRKAKAKAKAEAARIQRLYGERCSGVQINVMDIGKVFKVAERAIAQQPDISDQQLGNEIAEFVQTIRVN